MPERSFLLRRLLALFFLLLCLPVLVAAWYFFADPITAQVTIQPAVRTIQRNTRLTVVTGQPDLARQEITGAHWLSAVFMQTALRPATGHGYQPATQASGMVTLASGNARMAYVFEAKGAELTGTDGVTIVSDQSVLAFFGQPGYFHAHVLTPGTSGNIPAYGFHSSYALQGQGNSRAIFYNTTAFTGGQNAVAYTYVQRSDITSVQPVLTSTVTLGALNVLNGRLASGEQWIQSPACLSVPVADAAVNQRVTSFHLTVTTTCRGEVYNPHTLIAVAVQQFTTSVERQLKTNYQLRGSIAVSINNIQVLNREKGVLAATFHLQGRWVYSIDEAQKQYFARLIRGKSVFEAHELLAKQAAVARVTIKTANTFWIWNTLPGDSTRISLTVSV